MARIRVNVRARLMHLNLGSGSVATSASGSGSQREIQTDELALIAALVLTLILASSIWVASRLDFEIGSD